MVLVNPNLQTIYRKQKTLKKSISFSGIGVHTGTVVSMRFLPAREGSGVSFKRIDLPGNPEIPATIEYVCDVSSRCTTLGIKDVRIYTVEHVLAALKAYEIDNVIIEISALEPPVGNGSSDVFVEMIEEAGVEEQTLTIPTVKLHHPIFISENDVHLVALPHDGYKISYTLDYPDSKVLKQFQSFEITPETFKKEISSCRTFSRYEEVSALMDRGLIKGGSLENGVIIKEDVVFSKNGLFFPDEMVRHKILDIIGDFSLIGFNFHAHVISIRSGHATNYAFAKKIYNYITMENN